MLSEGTLGLGFGNILCDLGFKFKVGFKVKGKNAVICDDVPSSAVSVSLFVSS